MGNWIFTEVEITSPQLKGLEIVEKMKQNIITEDDIEILDHNGLHTKVQYRTKGRVEYDIFFDLSEEYEDTIIRVIFDEHMMDLSGVLEFINGEGLGVWGRPERNDPDNPYMTTNPFTNTKFNFQQRELNKRNK